MTLTNKPRADRCAHAIADYSDDEPYTNLIDWLADALHWCDLNDHEFDDAIDSARMHYDAELLEEGPQGRHA